jgi:CubicO group peptidase (beta-lactamase class C family)
MSDAVHGLIPDEFEAVADVLAASLGSGEEHGARFSVAIEGEIVLDVWGGFADRAKTRPWAHDTLVPVFSTTKAVTAFMMARLVEQGRLDYEQRVAEIWSEFGQAGKDRITVGQLLSHQAGLSGFSPPQAPEIWSDPPAVLDALARQAPLWTPGTASGYHPVTIGYMAGELFRRLDGRTIGAALREDFAQPYGLDVWIGLPDSEHDRVADVRKPTAMPNLGVIDAVKRAAFLDRGSTSSARNEAEWRRMEIPSTNGHATAPGLARLLSVLANGGKLDGRHVLSSATLAQATRERIVGEDKVLPFRLSWAAGFMRNKGVRIYGPGEQTVGHSGWGGSCVFADPERRLSVAYVMNRQSAHLIGDPRPLKLIESLYGAL